MRRAGPALPATPCPRAGGSRGSRAGRRPVPQGRVAPLTRGYAGPYQRPPPTRPRYAQHGRVLPARDGDVLRTTARIRRSLNGQGAASFPGRSPTRSCPTAPKNGLHRRPLGLVVTAMPADQRHRPGFGVLVLPARHRAIFSQRKDVHETRNRSPYASGSPWVSFTRQVPQYALCEMADGSSPSHRRRCQGAGVQASGLLARSQRGGPARGSRAARRRARHAYAPGPPCRDRAPQRR